MCDFRLPASNVDDCVTTVDAVGVVNAANALRTTLHLIYAEQYANGCHATTTSPVWRHLSEVEELKPAKVSG